MNKTFIIVVFNKCMPKSKLLAFPEHKMITVASSFTSAIFFKKALVVVLVIVYINFTRATKLINTLGDNDDHNHDFVMILS